MNIGDDVAREERMMEASYKKIKMTPGFMAKGLVEYYVDTVKGYMKCRYDQLTSRIVKDFYDRLSDDLNKYAEENLRSKSKVFDLISEHTDDILYGKSPYVGFGVKEAFDPLAPESSEIRAILDNMVDSIPKDKMELALKRADLLSAAQKGWPSLSASFWCLWIYASESLPKRAMTRSASISKLRTRWRRALRIASGAWILPHRPREICR